MSEKGILFSSRLALAILEGRKTQTRRVVAEPKCARLYGRRSLPEKHYADPGLGAGGYLKWAYGGGDHGEDWLIERVFCPYGDIGDRLYVREVCWAWGKWVADGTTKTGRPKRRFVYVGKQVRFDEPPASEKAKNGAPGWVYRHGRFMPRWASRTTLEITAIRVERLQSISDADALAEGLNVDGIEPPYTRVFKALWNSINGARPGCSWADNPWLFVITFNRAEQAAHGGKAA